MRIFEPDQTSAHVIDFQRIKIQEIMDLNPDDIGRIPRTIECELTEDLVDSCIPGDIASFTGIVKAVRADISNSHTDKNKSLYLLYLDVKSINNSVGKENGEKADVMSFSVQDFQAIQEIALQTDVFCDVVNSFCPSIYGQELVKAGIILAIFGGVPKNIGDKNKLLTRGDPHVLIVCAILIFLMI